MHRGYVKLWRKSLDNGWLKDHKLWSLWSWCLIKASHKEIKILVGLQEITLLPGQFVFGRKNASQELDISESGIYRRIEFLKNAGNLDIKPNNKFSIISIINWDTYQAEETQIEQQMNNKRTTSEQQPDTNKNVKNKKNNTYSDDFNIFYGAYPRRVNKLGAWQAWEKCNGDRPSLDALLCILEKQKKSYDWTKENGKYIPHPSTWINKKRWDDEVVIDKHDNTKPIITG